MQPLRLLSTVLSLRYSLLRAWTSGGSLLAGLIQIYVFARVLDPQRFSLFILVGAMGITMWLFDLGLPKIIFVRLRQRFLAGEDTASIAAQANALAIFYGFLVAAGSIVCFMLMATRPAMPLWHAAELALFFFFSSINLAWFVLRNISVAVDEYIFFETLEASRRVGYIALLLLMLVGFPFAAFIIAINVGWIVLFVLAGTRLVRRRALAPQFHGIVERLRLFFRENARASLHTGTHALGEIYIHMGLYVVVPLAFGLGAPTIMLDNALKIFFGTLNLSNAACDLLVPRQTAAYADRDLRMLKRTTLTALGLCSIPALCVTALLLIDAKGFFAFLLGQAATMPASVTPVLIVLMAAGAAKAAPNVLLQNTGYFHAIAKLTMITAVLLTVAIGLGVLAGLDIVGMLAIFAGVFVVGALLFLGTAWRGPIQDVRNGTC